MGRARERRVKERSKDYHFYGKERKRKGGQLSMVYIKKTESHLLYIEAGEGSSSLRGRGGDNEW
jgi:hypothetical protein